MVSDWFRERWPDIVLPGSVFLAWLFASLWLRASLFRAFGRWASQTKWRGDEVIARVSRRPFLFWCLLLGAYVAFQVSVLGPEMISLSGKILGSLFVASFFLVAGTVAAELLKLHLPKVPRLSHGLVGNIARVVLLVVGALVLLDLWGAPTTPIVLALLALGVVVVVASRDALPNVLAALQLGAGGHIKEGDYIKLDSGE